MREESVRAELERVLASSEFAKAERLSRWLRYLVNRTLEGRAGELKEYSIGVEVFERGADFDPRLDPIVRVEARRLRERLDRFYAAQPGGEVRISLPKGGYVPAFEVPGVAVAEPANSPTPPQILISRRAWVVGGVGATAAAGFGLLRWSDDAEAVDRLPVAVLAYPENEDPGFADGLGELLSVQLAQDPAWRVVAWPRIVEYQSVHRGETNPTAAAQRELVADVVLALYTHREGDRRRITAIAFLTGGRFKEFAGEYERGLEDPLGVQREVARAITGQLSGVVSKLKARRG